MLEILEPGIRAIQGGFIRCPTEDIESGYYSLYVRHFVHQGGSQAFEMDMGVVKPRFR